MLVGDVRWAIALGGSSWSCRAAASGRPVRRRSRRSATCAARPAQEQHDRPPTSDAAAAASGRLSHQASAGAAPTRQQRQRQRGDARCERSVARPQDDRDRCRRDPHRRVDTGRSVALRCASLGGSPLEQLATRDGHAHSVRSDGVERSVRLVRQERDSEQRQRPTLTSQSSHSAPRCCPDAARLSAAAERPSPRAPSTGPVRAAPARPQPRRAREPSASRPASSARAARSARAAAQVVEDLPARERGSGLRTAGRVASGTVGHSQRAICQSPRIQRCAG